MTIVYDGDCPVCLRFVDYISLRENTTLHLVDARQGGELVEQLWHSGINLHKTFAVRVNERVYAGAEGMAVLESLSNNRGLNRQLMKLFRWGWLGRCLYPVLVRIRLALLWLKGVKPLTNKS